MRAGCGAQPDRVRGCGYAPPCPRGTAATAHEDIFARVIPVALRSLPQSHLRRTASCHDSTKTVRLWKVQQWTACCRNGPCAAPASANCPESHGRRAASANVAITMLRCDRNAADGVQSARAPIRRSSVGAEYQRCDVQSNAVIFYYPVLLLKSP